MPPNRFCHAKTLLGTCEQHEGNPRMLCARNPGHRSRPSLYSTFTNLSTQIHCAPLRDTSTRVARRWFFHQSTTLITTTVLFSISTRRSFVKTFITVQISVPVPSSDNRLCGSCKILCLPHFHSDSTHHPLYTLLKNEYSTSAAKFDGRPPCPLREPRARKANRWNSA
jgi:hypothetical protein